MKLQTRFLGAILFTVTLPAALATGPYDIGRLGPDSAIDEIWPFQDGLAAIQIGRKWGFINRDGKLVVPPQFEEPSVFVNGLASVQTKEGEGYLNKDGTWKIPPKFQVAFNFGKTAALVEYPNQTWALIDRDGKDIYTFPPELDPHGDFEQGLLRVGRNYPQQLRHLDGRTVTLPIGTSLHGWQSHLGDGLIGMSQRIPGEYRTRMGYVDPQGKWVIPPKFDEISQFRHGVALVKEGEASGLINTRGEWLIKLSKDESLQRDEDSGMYAVMDKQRAVTQLLSREGRKLHGAVPECSMSSSQRAPIDWFLLGNADCTAFKILTNDGRQISLPLLPTRIERKHGQDFFVLTGYQPDPLATRKKPAPKPEDEDRQEDPPPDTHFAIIDPSGNILADSSQLPVKGEFSNLTVFNQAEDTPAQPRLPLAYFKNKTGIYIVTPDGKTVHNPEWQGMEVYWYSEKQQGPLVVETRRGWGAIDANGKWLIEPGFDKLSQFKFGIAHVRQHKDEFLVDATGKRMDYPEGRSFSILAPDTLLGQSENGPQLFKPSTGKTLLLPNAGGYGFEFKHGLAPLQNSNWGLVNTDGEWITPPAYADKPEPLLDSRGKLLGWSVWKDTGASKRHEERRYGLLSPDGKKEVIKPIYSKLQLDNAGRLIGEQPFEDDAVLNLEGKALLRGGHITALGDGWYVTQKQSELGYMNEAGKWVLEPRLIDQDGYFNKNFPYTRARVNGEMAFIDPQGRVSTQYKPQAHTLPDTPDNWWPEWDSNEDITTYYGFDWHERLQVKGAGEHFFNGIAVLNVDHHQKQSLINGKGEFVYAPKEVELGKPSEGMTVIEQEIKLKPGVKLAEGQRNVRYGYLDRNGKQVIPSRFEGAQPFSEGRAGVVVNGNIGIIDTKGKLIVHSGWQCSVPVLLDANRKVTWTTKPSCKEPIKLLPPENLRCNCGMH